MNSDSIPNDLIMEIFSRLPAKSIARFHCLSKLWESKFGRPDFRELFLTRSSAKPRIIFAIEEKGLWSIFSLPQHQRPYEKPSSSLVLPADFHMKFPPESMRIYHRDDRQFACGYASGLIYFYGMWIKNEDYSGVPVICNPKTGRYATLPKLIRYRRAYSFIGFDPIGKQFKVLFMAYPCGPDHHRILRLGTGERRYKKIRCSIKHEGLSEGICINGVLYYLADMYENMPFTDLDDMSETEYFVIVCFDVRSEKFKFIYPESFCELINYKGKLGVVYYDDNADDVIELRVWVLEDVEKEEWSKYAYILRDDMFLVHYVSVVGVIATGEVVLSMASYTSKQPFYVFYYNPERNTVQRVEIQGFGDYHEASKNPSIVHVFVDDCSSFYAFADQAEDLNVYDSKLLNSSIYAPYVKTEEEELDDINIKAHDFSDGYAYGYGDNAGYGDGYEDEEEDEEEDDYEDEDDYDYEF